MMSNVDPSITNSMVIPSIETDLFRGHEDVRFGIGLLAVGSVALPGRESALDGYHILRGGVYARQTRMISTDLLNRDGSEYDRDDSRSAHFGVIENSIDGQRVVGAMRLIIKAPRDPRELPIEQFFPEAFDPSEPAPLLSIEVSRYIARHEVRAIERLLTNPMLTASLAHVISHDLGPTYAVVESLTRRRLIGQGIPVRDIAPQKFVKEYADKNLAIHIDTEQLAITMGLNGQSKDSLRAFGDNFSYYNLVEKQVGQSAMSLVQAA